MGSGWIILIVVILLVIFIYNNLVGKKNKVESSLSTIDTYLQKRFDLLTSLFNQLETELDHEAEVYGKVTKNRTGFDQLKEAYLAGKDNPKAVVEADRAMSNMFSGMRSISEQYPQLQSIQAVMQVMNQTVTVENELNASRRQYNANVQSFRNAIESFPNVILAGMFGFKDIYELYKADEEAKPRPKTPAEAYHNAKYNKKIEDLNDNK